MLDFHPAVGDVVIRANHPPITKIHTAAGKAGNGVEHGPHVAKTEIVHRRQRVGGRVVD